MLLANGELRYEIASQISATWMEWHSTSFERFKFKIYRSIASYGSAYWQIVKDNAKD